jgi:uncharacterized protein YidB (DUF937 family)
MADYLRSGKVDVNLNMTMTSYDLEWSAGRAVMYQSPARPVAIPLFFYAWIRESSNLFVMILSHKPIAIRHCVVVDRGFRSEHRWLYARSDMQCVERMLSSGVGMLVGPGMFERFEGVFGSARYSHRHSKIGYELHLFDREVPTDLQGYIEAVQDTGSQSGVRSWAEIARGAGVGGTVFIRRSYRQSMFDREVPTDLQGYTEAVQDTGSQSGVRSWAEVARGAGVCGTVFIGRSHRQSMFDREVPTDLQGYTEAVQDTGSQSGVRSWAEVARGAGVGGTVFIGRSHRQSM